MAANLRQARRRRILEQGSDRLALITGQIQSLPSSSASPPLYDQSKNSSSQPLISNQQDLRPPFPDQPTVSHDKNKLIDSTLQHKDPQINARSTAYYGTNTGPSSSKSTEIEATVASTPEDGGRAQNRDAPTCIAPSEGQDSALSTVGGDQFSKPKSSSFSLNELSSAISESETTRLCFSAIIAFLAVASYVVFPFLGQSLMRIGFGSRPLYLVLLTNLTVVLWRLIFTKQKGLRVSGRGEGQVTAPAQQSSVELIGMALEAGIVAQKAMGAIFIDCSVFAVIVVSGLSLAQRL